MIEVSVMVFQSWWA